MSRLRRRRCRCNCTTPRNALVGRERCAVLDGFHEKIERMLCMREDVLELRIERFVVLDVIAVLHLVQAIRRLFSVVVAIPVPVVLAPASTARA